MNLIKEITAKEQKTLKYFISNKKKSLIRSL